MSASLKMFQTYCVCANRIPINIEKLFLLRRFSTSATLLTRKKPSKDSDAEVGDSIDPNLKSAADTISSKVGRDKKEIGNDLISQLKKMQVKQTEKQENNKRKEYLSDVLSNMKVDRKISQTSRRMPDRFQNARNASIIDDEWKSIKPPTRTMKSPTRTQRKSLLDQDYKLFEGKGLGIFSKEDLLKQPEEGRQVKETLWDVIKREELETVQNAVPTNAFEEMIEWTKQGKIWKFPIDNEQDWESEKNTGFHEHIFLEHHTEGFPTRGPLRHFIDLVVVALSKNAFLTVQQKRDHIEWFRQYFIEKREILEETLGEDGKVEPSPEQQLLESSSAS